MSLETSAFKLCVAVGKAADSAAPKEIKSAVNTRAVFGGIVMAIPLFVFETIIYAIIRWRMYGAVARIAGIKFSGNLVTNVIGGFIINIVITFILNLLLEWILFFGWIGMFFAGYFATRYSGIAYLGILEAFYDRNKLKLGLDYDAAKKTFTESGGKDAVKGIAKSAVINQITD